MIIKFCDQRKEGLYYEELSDLIKMVEYCTQSLIDGVQVIFLKAGNGTVLNCYFTMCKFTF
jgi:hypothetical protein